MSIILLALWVSFSAHAARVVPLEQLTNPHYTFPSCARAYENKTSSTFNPDGYACYLHKGVAKDVRQMNQKLQQDFEVKMVAGQMRPKIQQMLDQSLAAREKLISCVDSAEVDCKERIARLLRELNHQMKSLRAALSIGSFDPYAAPARRDRLERDINYPAYLGRPAMPPLAGDEVKMVQGFKKRLMDTIEKRESFKFNGVEVQPEEAAERCAHSHSDECEKNQITFQTARVHLYEEAQKVVLRLIDEMPFVTQFGNAPITVADLKRALVSSRAALQKWKQDVSTHMSAADLIFVYPNVADQVLGADTKFCDAVQSGFKESANRQNYLKYGTMLGQAALTFVACAFTDGLGCGVAGIGLSAINTTQAYSDHQALAQKYAVQGKVEAYNQNDLDNNVKEGRSLIQATDVMNAHSDFLINAAFGAVSAGAPWVPKALSLAKGAQGSAVTLEESGGFLEEKGAESVLREAQDPLVSNTRQEAVSQAAKDSSGVPSPGQIGDLLYQVLKESIPY